MAQTVAKPDLKPPRALSCPARNAWGVSRLNSKVGGLVLVYPTLFAEFRPTLATIRPALCISWGELSTFAPKLSPTYPPLFRASPMPVFCSSYILRGGGVLVARGIA